MANRFGRILLLLLLAGGTPSTFANDLALRVRNLQPEPNYPLTRDSGDMDQLTDGQVNSFPFWTQRDSVGWQQRTPIRITLQAAMHSGVPYRLRIRTAYRDPAGVHPPRRVDVYCGDGASGGLRHVVELRPQKADFEREGVVDLAIPFVGCKGGVLDVILHAEGQYLMLDEITLTATRAAGRLPAATVDARMAADVGVDAMEDSRARLEQDLRKLGRGQATQSVSRLVARRKAWLASPWDDPGARDAGTSLEVLSLPTAGAAYVVGIRNTAAKPQRHVLSLDPGIAKQAGIARLRPVLSANGKTVFDALEPVDALAWEIPAGETLHLLIQEPRRVPSGGRLHRVADGQGTETSLRVNVTLLDRIQPENTDRPQVNVWAYTNDQPIWKPGNKEKLMEELTEAGVNVHLVATRNIPMPFTPASQENEKRLPALAEDVRLYKGRGLILLFTGRNLWNQIKEQGQRPEAEKALGLWAANLARFMREQGVPAEQWALYLVDEPRNEDLETLAWLIPLLRKEAPQLRFFANPIPGRGAHALGRGAIRDLSALVDYWQPRAGAAHKITREALPDSSRGRVWLYDNPCPPAKSAAPSWYRGLARRALDAGARGFGFWSFSATNNSSAWDDLDGHRADWAVVYEADDGVVSSRRWEAFKQGIQDYAALRYCSRRAGADPALAAQCGLLRDATAARDTQCRD